MAEVTPEFDEALDRILAFRNKDTPIPSDAEFEIVPSPRRGHAVRINVRFTLPGSPGQIRMIAKDVTAADAARLAAVLHDLLAKHR